MSLTLKRWYIWSKIIEDQIVQQEGERTFEEAQDTICQVRLFKIAARDGRVCILRTSLLRLVYCKRRQF